MKNKTKTAIYLSLTILLFSNHVTIKVHIFFYLGMALLTCGVVLPKSLYSTPSVSFINAMHNKKIWASTEL